MNTARFLKYVWPIFKIMHEKVKNLTLPEASFAYFKLKFDQSLKEEECHEILSFRNIPKQNDIYLCTVMVILTDIQPIKQLTSTNKFDSEYFHL